MPKLKTSDKKLRKDDSVNGSNHSARSGSAVSIIAKEIDLKKKIIKKKIYRQVDRE